MDGILLLSKPLRLSSNQALQTVKRLVGADKAGHVGSLDPLATGMLPICLGEATKIAGEILGGRKRYEFTVKLGARTATGDTEGEVVETCVTPPLEHRHMERVLKGFVGRQQQTPPMYSAIKKDGQPLYKLARLGQEIERVARTIEIFELTLAGFDNTSLQLETSCSKGTYIRVLAEDIARALGTCGHVTRLHRTGVEPFENEPMQTLEGVETAPRILPADRGVPHLPRLDLSAAQTERIGHGQQIFLAGSTVTGRVRLYDAKRRFFGIGEVENERLRGRRLWAQGPPSRIARLEKG